MPSLRGFGSTAVDNSTIENNSSGQLQVKDSGISSSKLGSDVVTGDLKLLSTTIYDGDAGINIDLAGYSMYVVRYQLKPTISQFLKCRFNGASSVIYSQTIIDNLALAASTENAFVLGYAHTNVYAIGKYEVSNIPTEDAILIHGNSQNYSNGDTNMEQALQRGVVESFTTTLNKIRIYVDTGALSGKVLVYGVIGYETA